MANELSKLLGGDGCDIVSSVNSPFTARLGRIYAIVPCEDDTEITSIKEDNDGVSTEVTSRSWIGGESSGVYPSLKKDAFIVPDYPVSEITVYSGSVMVYYASRGWQKA